LNLADVKHALGDAFGGVVPAREALAREAVDRGVPLEHVQRRNKIAASLKKLILAAAVAKIDAKSGSTGGARSLSPAHGGVFRNGGSAPHASAGNAARLSADRAAA
jgi:Flp pilus assembly CpaE family ATPase